MFVASESSVTRHGAYAIEREPQTILKPQGTGVGCLAGQFPWGPDSADLTKPYEPSDRADLLKTFGPIGMDRTKSGYLCMIAAAFPTLKVCRVLGSTAAKASVTLDDGAGTPVDIITLEAKYKGSEGNKLDAIVTDADDGDSNHFNLEVKVSDSSGTTSERWRNLNYSGVGTAAYADVSNSRLVGAVTIDNAGVPESATSDFTGGLDGTIDAAAYSGTAGTGNKGIALAENDKSIRAIFSDDPGDTLRAGVMSALVTHAVAMGDRRAFINGDSGLTLAQVQTDKASYASEYAIYGDPWAKIYDDIDGTLRLVPPAVFEASVRCQLSPSTSIAWKHSKVGDMLSRIIELETPRGNGAGSNTNVGISTIINEEGGGFRIEAGVTTIAPSAPTKRNETRLSIGIYIATTFTRSVREMVDAPNVELNQMNLVTALKTFMEKLKQNAKTDPNGQPHVIDYRIGDLSSVNDAQSRANGDFYIPLDVTTSSGMERIFLSFKFGEGVLVEAA